METTVGPLKEADTEALASVAFQARQNSERRSQELSITRFKDALDSAADDEELKVVLCKSKNSGNLLGWMSLHTGYPRMVFIGEWHPEVRPVDSYGLVAKTLIRRAKQATQEMGKERLEVQFDRITTRIRPLLQKFETWYRNEGFQHATEETYMEASISDKLPKFEMPDELTVVPISEVDNEDLKSPFFDSFLDSKDGLFLSLTGNQQMDAFNYWFNRSRRFIDEATLCVKSGNRVVGFLVVREEEGKPYVGPIGVHPEFRRRGIGKALLAQGMEAIRILGYRKIALEMDISNAPAMKVYQKFGFQSVHNASYFYWGVEGY